MQRGTTGSGREYYKRDRALNRGEIDIFVDSRVPILQEVLKWAERVTGKSRVIYFETGDRDYFQELKRVLGTFGFTLIGNPPGYKQAATVRGLLEARPELRPTDEVPEAELDQLVPRLIYYNTTAQSVNAAYTSRIKGGSDEADPSRCCVVVDKYSGMEALDYLREESGYQLSVICPAMIYDDLLRQVRVWIRLGETLLPCQPRTLIYAFDMCQATTQRRFKPRSTRKLRKYWTCRIKPISRSGPRCRGS